MKNTTKIILTALLMIISGIAGCLDADTIPEEDSSDDGIDGSNGTANQTGDNNTGLYWQWDHSEIIMHSQAWLIEGFIGVRS